MLNNATANNKVKECANYQKGRYKKE